MSILSAIKGPKVLSANHWRYRLLHWTFQVPSDRRNPEFSQLPHFLYKHYCPLFHLTNFIVLILPVITTVRGGYFVGKKFVDFVNPILGIVVEFGFEYVIGPVADFFAKFKKIEVKEKEEKVVEISEEEIKYHQWRLWFKVVMGSQTKESSDAPYTGMLSFQRCWSIFWSECERTVIIDAEEAELKYDVLVAKIEEARALSAARKKRMRELIIFWVGFSRMLIKSFLYVLYAGAAVAALWFLIFIVPSVLFSVISTIGFVFGWMYNLIVSMFTSESFIPFMFFVGKIVALAATITAGGIALSRVSAVEKTVECASRVWDSLTPPAEAAGRAIATPFRKIGGAVLVVKEFVEVFYEENCPPIVYESSSEEKEVA